MPLFPNRSKNNSRLKKGAGYPLLQSATAELFLIRLFGVAYSGFYPYFPVSLPAPNVNGYSVKRSASSVRTDMAAGVPRMRRISTVNFATVSCKFSFKPTEYALFDAFYNYLLQDGTLWFKLNLATPAGLKLCTVRFVQHFDEVVLAGLHREVSCQIEVRDWPAMPYSQFVGAYS